MTKLKLKKKVKVIIILIIFFIIASFVGNKLYKDYLYKQTYEYKLVEHGYTLDETKTLIANFNDTYLEAFLNKDVDKTTLDLLKAKYYLNKNYDRYLDYLKNNSKTTIDKTITIVNTNNDLALYENVFETDTAKDTLILVNKYYYLPKEYEVSDLKVISTNYSWGNLGSQKTRQITYDAFLQMWEAAKAENIYLMINSSFRTYDDQARVYNNYKELKGEKYADSIAARAGHSEHETGLALDIFAKDATNKNTFQESSAFSWLKDNAYLYGFILRYPDGKEDITGCTFESWHYRYVGIDVATYIYQNNITFDEYYAYYLDK